MSRKHRIESNDGLYHILNRGNYRRNIFASEGAKGSFEALLFEAAEKSGWEVYAYVIMRNHYHLAIGTAKGNLISGMQWLQSTYANRFNRLRKAHGHLFQGRYKSLLVEPGTHLCDLVDYIHLNPVRAGIVKVEGLKEYAWGSFPKFFKRRRPACLNCQDWMVYTGDLVDRPKGWRIYWERLKLKDTKNPKERAQLSKRMTRGWCIGSRAYKKALVKQMQGKEGVVHREGIELREMNELSWEHLLETCLTKLKKSTKDIKDEKKSARWKLALASYMKSRTSVPNRWIAEKLYMGHPNAMSHNCSIYRREDQKSCRWNKILQSIQI